MITAMKQKLISVPTPMAGLALAIASLGWCWESMFNLSGYGQWISAAIASGLLIMLILKNGLHWNLLKQDLAHPVIGSVIPTFAMAMMIISNSIHQFNPIMGDLLWLLGVVLHILFMGSFFYHRSKQFKLHHMLPSWFVPPVGIIVADVSFAGNPILLPIAQAALIFGLISYAVLLPTMIYRVLFSENIPHLAQPTIAILAAPASLSLAGYLTVSQTNSPVIIGILFGIAVLMTFITYLALFKLLTLPFSPGFAAFTFPTVISATALFKMATWMQSVNVADEYVMQIQGLAEFELVIATVIVSYVAIRYMNFFFSNKRMLTE